MKTFQAGFASIILLSIIPGSSYAMGDMRDEDGLAPTEEDQSTWVSEISSHTPENLIKPECSIDLKARLRKCCLNSQRRRKPMVHGLMDDWDCTQQEYEISVETTNFKMESRVDAILRFPMQITKECFGSTERYILDLTKHQRDTKLEWDEAPVKMEQEYSKDDFCINYTNYSEENSVVKCQDRGGVLQTPVETKRLVNPILNVVSILPLLITFFVYVLIPNLRTLHGKCLICYVLCQLLTHSFFALSTVTNGWNKDPACRFILIGGLFSCLAMYFWMNVISYDIWSSYKDLLQVHATGRRGREQKKYISYSIYAWGGPTVILAIALVIECTPFRLMPSYFVGRCSFKESIRIWYCYGPAGLLMMANVVFFIMATRNIGKGKELKTFINSIGARIIERKSKRNRYKLYIRLMMVTSVQWGLELASSAVGGNGWWRNTTDIANCLQGVVVFFILVCNTKTRALLKEKIWPKEGVEGDKNRHPPKY